MGYGILVDTVQFGSSQAGQQAPSAVRAGGRQIAARQRADRAEPLQQASVLRARREALLRGELAGGKLPAYFRLLAQAQERAGRAEAAFETLEEGWRRFPDRPELLRQQALLLVAQGLFLAALDRASQYLARRPDDRAAHLVLGEALRSAGRPREAAVLLEEAALRFEDDAEVAARLALAYARAGHHLASGRLFARAVDLGGDYAYEAAEELRAAGRLSEALRYNARVPDAPRRLRQRLATHLAAERFARAAALDGPLAAAGALDDVTSYRLAYAHLRAGDLDRAEALCGRVEDPGLAPDVARLLEAVDERRRGRGPGTGDPGEAGP